MSIVDEKNTMVWSDDNGDLRKRAKELLNVAVDESKLVIKIRRLSAGKGRTVIELSDLPSNKSWCDMLIKNMKKSLAAGGTYKNNCIEIHLADISKVINFLEKKSLKYKQIGG